MRFEDNFLAIHHAATADEEWCASNKAGNMPFSLTDVLLTPVERPRCARCRMRMNLTSITPRPDHSEKRIFECPKCQFIDTKVATDLLGSNEVNRLPDNVRPPA
jgi:hypothetical protein